MEIRIVNNSCNEIAMKNTDRVNSRNNEKSNLAYS